MTQYHYDKDADGIVTVTLDAAGQSANTMTAVWLEAMFELLDRLRAEDKLTGVVIASAKRTFFAGGDLNEMLAMDASAETLFAYVERAKAPFRQLEQLEVPVVAAINGAALGGGYELCLACNHRVIVDDPKAVVGLPEVTLGLLPGAGGVVRLTALLGLEAALKLLTEGTRLSPAKALKSGLVDKVVGDPAALIPAAKEWIKANPTAAKQPWDIKGFAYPGGPAAHPKVRQIATMAPMMVYNKTQGRLPAPAKIVDVAVNSMRMGFASALRAESRAFVSLLRTPEARAAISTFFFGRQRVKSEALRPAGEKLPVQKVQVFGRSSLSDGIVWAQAAAGINTVLAEDIGEGAATHFGNLANKKVEERRLTPDAAQAALLRISVQPEQTDADMLLVSGIDELAAKRATLALAVKEGAADAIVAVETAQIPLSELVVECADPSRVVGLHFFAPVEHKKLAEVIVSPATSSATLARAYDYVQQMGYLPIVVSDRPGFYAPRVFMAYLDEAARMLREGVAPIAIERAAWLAGFPLGPLAAMDRVGLGEIVSAQAHWMDDAQRSLPNFDVSALITVTETMVAKGGMAGATGQSFYITTDGGVSILWPGLAELAEGACHLDIAEIGERLLMRHVAEAARCMSEGVVTTDVEANLASILAIGCPPNTGGPIQWIRGLGQIAFSAKARALAQTNGPRFEVTDEALAALFPGARQEAA